MNKVHRFVVLLCLAAGCSGNGEESNSTTVNVETTGDSGIGHFCGPVSWIRSSSPNTPWLEHESTCFDVTVEPVEDGAVLEPGTQNQTALRVIYRYWLEEAGECVISGLDGDGYANGLTAVLDQDSGGCVTVEDRPNDGAPVHVVHRWTVQSGDLRLQRLAEGDGSVLTWSLRATAKDLSILVENGEPFANFVEDGASLNHDGFHSSETVMQPADSYEQPCEINGCYEVSYGDPEFVVGEEYEGCRNIAAQAGSPTAEYNVVQNGAFTDDGIDLSSWHRFPRACRFINEADLAWATVIDYDADTATVSFDGLPLTPETSNGAVECKIRWDGELRPCGG